MLQNARGAAFIISESLREKQQWDSGEGVGEGTNTHHPPRLGLNYIVNNYENYFVARNF